MQTFLPYPNFRQSAQALDSRRLGKQRVETLQILNALEGKSKGWTNHPATRMWSGHQGALALYGVEMCREWLVRGYNDALLPRFVATLGVAEWPLELPPWLGDPSFHLSHRSNLVRKLPEHYGVLWPDVEPTLPYVWPAPKDSA